LPESEHIFCVQARSIYIAENSFYENSGMFYEADNITIATNDFAWLMEHKVD
jgi:hypothetical protein